MEILLILVVGLGATYGLSKLGDGLSFRGKSPLETLLSMLISTARFLLNSTPAIKAAIPPTV